MAYEQRDMSGSLFKNDRRTNDKQPEYNGTIVVDGVEYWLSAWVKESSRGRFFSLAVKPKEDRQSKPAAQQNRETARSEPTRDNSDEYPGGPPADEVPF